jgi:hypothetical protein
MKRVARAQPGLGTWDLRGIVAPVLVRESLSCKIV